MLIASGHQQLIMSGDEEKIQTHAHRLRAETGMAGPASLDDPLLFLVYPGTKHKVKLRDMMSTVSSILGICYQY
jgi:hypothetical protein